MYNILEWNRVTRLGESSFPNLKYDEILNHILIDLANHCGSLNEGFEKQKIQNKDGNQMGHKYY